MEAFPFMTSRFIIRKMRHSFFLTFLMICLDGEKTKMLLLFHSFSLLLYELSVCDLMGLISKSPLSISSSLV